VVGGHDILRQGDKGSKIKRPVDGPYLAIAGNLPVAGCVWGGIACPNQPAARRGEGFSQSGAGFWGVDAVAPQ